MVTGQGRYLADTIGEGALWAGFLRSDMASARIERLDTGQALELPGVRAVFTAADLAADGVPPIRHEPPPREDGGAPATFSQPILCGDRVRHLGEPLALVVAETRTALWDALEALEVDLEPEDPVAGRAFFRRFGDAQATSAVIEGARHRHAVVIEIPRVTAFALEPRAAVARSDGARLDYRASTQSPFALRSQFAAHFGWDPEAIRVVAGDVGGSFGLKGYMTSEDAALAWAARRLKAEIAWLPTRSETMLADAQGRGVRGEVEVGLDDDLRLMAVRARFAIDAGAYPARRAMGIMSNINGLTGMYDIPAVSAEVEGVLSPRPPLAPFRGNGRPEMTYAIEHALDAAARAIGADPVELRRRNLLTPDRMPATTALGFTIDCGDFPRVMDAALVMAGDTEARRADAARRGRLHGFGLANCIETAGGPYSAPRPDFARLTVDAGGAVTLAPGVMTVGQGHETGLSAMAAERLGIPLERIRYVNGDTAAVVNGRGMGGSSGLTVAGSAVWQALEDMVAEGTGYAAAEFGCAPQEVTFRDGAFHERGTNRNMTLGQIAAGHPGGWQVEASFKPDSATFPNGTHICEVEIDPATGATEITRYSAVEDIGRILNPVLVEGQLQGGIAQGLSIGRGERIVYDEDGQLLTGSLMDYQLVRAADLPDFTLGSVEVPTALNPLGVKGVGEAGTVGATAAFASAVSDALFRAGVPEFDGPATPARVWKALQSR